MTLMLSDISGRSAADVSKAVGMRLQSVITSLQTLLRKHPSLYTIDILTALRHLQIRTKSIG